MNIADDDPKLGSETLPSEMKKNFILTTII